MWRLLFFALTVLRLGYGEVPARDKAVKGHAKELLLEYNFSHGAAGWLAGFSDYSL